MSYGVVIGMSTGTRLVESHGLATGQISSHRAECYGCLAGSLIVLHLVRYTGIGVPQDMEVQSFSDNQGMIRRLQQRQQYTIGYANTTLAPDWDLIEEIHQVYQTIPLAKHEYDWVRGHQDKGPITSLSTEAKFNIGADHLAGEYYIMGSASIQANDELLPHTKCRLRLQGKEIHGHYVSHIRRAAAQRSFRSYMQRRHEWDDVTYDDIDWESFHNATKHFEGDAIHLMKLVHDKLPTNLVKSRYHNYSSAKCHFCPHPETFNHLCTSTCNDRSIQFRNQIRQELTDILLAHTPKQFAITFLSALNIWFDGDDIEGSHEWEGPPSLRRAQHTIGWSRMFRGYLSKAWLVYLKQTIKTQQVKKWLYDNGQQTSRDGSALQDIYNPYSDKVCRNHNHQHVQSHDSFGQYGYKWGFSGSPILLTFMHQAVDHPRSIDKSFRHK